MNNVWAGIAIVILALIVYAIVSNKIRNRRIRKAVARMLPRLVDHIQAGRRYNIFLSHGKTLLGVKFLGISEPYEQHDSHLPFPLCQWLIVEKDNGNRAYIKPMSVRYYEDAEGEVATPGATSADKTS